MTPRRPISMVLTSAGGTQRALSLELANDPVTRHRGLTGRRHLGGLDGMLFAWPDDTASPFTMRHTPFGLDFAALDARGVVLWTREGVPAYASDPVAPPLAYRYALEAPAWSFEAWRLEPGSRLWVPDVVAASAA